MISGDTSPQDEMPTGDPSAAIRTAEWIFVPSSPGAATVGLNAQWLAVTCLGFAGQHCLGG